MGMYPNRGHSTAMVARFTIPEGTTLGVYPKDILKNCKVTIENLDEKGPNGGMVELEWNNVDVLIESAHT